MDKKSIERVLLEENQRSYNQAADTAFLQEPLASLVGPLGNLAASREYWMPIPRF
jgi:hypothetical protein